MSLYGQYSEQRCQCPISGFSHFYLRRVEQQETGLLCQCPISGFSHFYWNNEDGIWYYYRVSMPYIGLLSFLHKQISGVVSSISVSMPYIGLLSFLRSPPKNHIKYGLSGPTFRGYFSEYSEISTFSLIICHVYNLFILFTFSFYPNFHKISILFLTFSYAFPTAPKLPPSPKILPKSNPDALESPKRGSPKSSTNPV